MKLFKVILAMLVGAIILLHTLIPHVHFDRVKEGVILYSLGCKADFFTDIQLSLGLDHGNGHFEHFFEVDNSFDSLSPADNDYLPPAFIATPCNSCKPRVSYSRGLLLQDQLRGPPVG